MGNGSGGYGSSGGGGSWGGGNQSGGGTTGSGGGYSNSNYNATTPNPSATDYNTPTPAASTSPPADYSSGNIYTGQGFQNQDQSTQAAKDSDYYGGGAGQWDAYKNNPILGTPSTSQTFGAGGGAEGYEDSNGKWVGYYNQGNQPGSAQAGQPAGQTASASQAPAQPSPWGAGPQGAGAGVAGTGYASLYGGNTYQNLTGTQNQPPGGGAWFGLG
jgi:hypothetical protein